MADPISGVRTTVGTTTGILAGARVVDMSDTIHLLDPNEAPLTALTMKLRTVPAISPKVEWMEDDYIPSADVTSTTVVTADTQVDVTNGAYFRAGDVVQCVDTGELMYVISISTDELTVARSIGATVATQMIPAAVLIIVGNANAENSTMRTIFTAKKTAAYNYCQIMRWEFGASGTTQASELYGGNDLSYQQKKGGKEFRIQMEKSYLFGERGILSGGNRRYCGGVIEKITTNITSSDTVSIAIFEAFLRSGMRYGPARKMFFASREIVSFLSIIADNKIQTRTTDKSFPLALTEYVSPHGKIYIVTHNQLKDNAPTSTLNNDAYHGWGLLLDLDSIFHRPLKGRNTMLRTNIQANDADGRVDGYLAECCPQIIQEKNHAVINGVTGTA